jgi:hypothetical protein
MSKPTKNDLAELIWSAKDLSNSVEFAIENMSNAVTGLLSAIGTASPEDAIRLIKHINDELPKFEKFIKEKEQEKAEFMLENGSTPKTRGH